MIVAVCVLEFPEPECAVEPTARVPGNAVPPATSDHVKSPSPVAVSVIVPTSGVS